MATSAALAPRASCESRAIALISENVWSRDITSLRAGRQRLGCEVATMSSQTFPQHVDDPQRQGGADYDHQRRQDESHQRQCQQDRETGRALLEAS